MHLFRRNSRAVINDPLLLRNGRVWSPEGIRPASVLVRDGVIEQVGDIQAPDANVVDCDNGLIAPGFIDCDHNLSDDCLPPLLPGPYLENERREEEIRALPPGRVALPAGASEADRWLWGAWLLLREGVTGVAYAGDAETAVPLRVARAVRVESLLLDKNPEKMFQKAKGGPIFVSVADGHSKAKAREFQKLVEWQMLGPNLIAVGGTAFLPADAQAIAEAGGFLVWRPIRDEFVFGRTLGPDVLANSALKVVFGSGARRDGGRGLIAAMRRANELGYLTRGQILNGGTFLAAEALQWPAGAVQPGSWADLTLWNAPDLDQVVFGPDRSPLRLVMVGGRIVLCHASMAETIGGLAGLRPSAVDPDFHCSFDVPRCFT